MEIRQLRYFVAIAQYGTFSKAAEKTFVAQSALSHQLAQLEEELGARLFHRSHRGVELTEAGRIFQTHAVAILRQIEDARSSVRSSIGQLTGKVVFGVPQSVSNALAVPLLQAVRQRYPQVELELTEELTGNLTHQLRIGRLNLAVLFDDGQLGEFAYERMVTERLSLIRAAVPGERVSAKGVSLKKALTLPLILPADPHGVRPIIEAKARASGYPPPNVVADISSVSILRTSLLAGLGQTLLPTMPLKHDIDAGLLHASPVVSPVLTRVVAICASKHIPVTAAADAVLRLTVELSHELCASGQWADATPIA
ncbi:LysR family transcriptional regulator [Azoarcus sp. KH32C]|uniref:LysR family transcriptional regulator n=1 Tax=Azoarcus sp. KH32C TaxID=748247 RepID=UPI0002386C8C|nr:LysR substrate-binding domain-containing protein [Azoarcus sp. KH32C]BAL24903.1 transcriptional regulator, LysR family [Azoarcus sp. KH32C]